MTHPYKDLEDDPQWAILQEGIRELEENDDLSLTTNSNYVVGHLIKKLTEKEEIKLGLSKDEALVLFELVSRFSEKDELKIEDESEERVLWSICSMLEKSLADPFKPNYRDILESSRENLKQT
tara:strand:+ start:68 stop:436 length:369 start_codon:yes stop_codon:yes gene_type:complete